MDFYVEQAVLDAGVKILFAAVYGIDNHGESPEWAVYREKRLAELYTAYEALEVHDDPILEGFNILHDQLDPATGGRISIYNTFQPNQLILHPHPGI